MLINTTALDNIIAVVVVLMLLSLIVQSIQSVLKKALKIKSRQIEASLLDLFENVVNFNQPVATTPSSIAGKLRKWLERIFGSSPILRRVFQFVFRRPHPSDPSQHPNEEVKQLFNEVIKGFEDIGRVAQTGKPMLDSISKDDLKKVMGKVLPDTLQTGFTTKLKAACAEIGKLEGAIEEINSKYLTHLSGDANAHFAALQQALAPLLNDLRAICVEGELSSTVVIETVLNLRDIEQSDVLAILGQLQKKVADDLKAARESAKDNPAQLDNGLDELSRAFGTIAASLVRLSSRLDEAVAPLRVKLSEVETWYDTVTQSFEERYTRGMKTWALVISFILVAYLNASIVDIYKNIVTNDAVRNQLLQIGEERTKANEQRLASAKEKREQQEVDATLQEIRNDTEEIRKQIANLSTFGFRPMTWGAVKERLNVNLWSSVGWFDRRVDDLMTIIGWIIMTFLLSVGAPFWEDILESLFGVKNILRQGTKTRNVEAESGAGQTKP